LTVPLSIDTYKSEVASRAVKSGASLINDVWGMKRDPALARVAARAGVPVVLTSNQREGGIDGDVMTEIIADLERSVSQALKAGVAGEKIIIDPGIGFGKTVEQNLEIIRRLAELRAMGRPILLGTSRKFMAGRGGGQRLWATSATVAIGIAHGADMVRAHDVREMATVCRMSDAISRKGER
jgi:dihydropteroate synthase